MSKKDDALKLAREALEYISSHYMSLPKIGCMALAAVDEAMAEQPAQQGSTCNKTLREQGKAYPRTCKKCGLGPCITDQVQPAQQHDYWQEEAQRYAQNAEFWRGKYEAATASKPWVGLTDEEMHACWDSPLTPLGMKHARLIEAKLKEKNNG